ncbi:MAG: type I-E CRISPR-associated protein Cse2/CasB [Atopobiaceae bacterium]|nr:type I-E CRISPR-associated protein Cse2/CasB [Atopobiaceae bacterium]
MTIVGWDDGRRLVKAYVKGRVMSLQRRLLSPQGKSSAAASLARLRRSVNKKPGATPDTWEIEFEDLPEPLVGSGPEASAGEWAVHLALSLYAVHQQSQVQEMHRQSSAECPCGIGHAVKKLALYSMQEGEELELGEMPKRYAAMVTAETIGEVAHYARQLVQQLRAKQIPLDYVLLSGQLYDYQNLYRRDAVRLEWGREFARPVKHQDSTETEEN